MRPARTSAASPAETEGGEVVVLLLLAVLASVLLSGVFLPSPPSPSLPPPLVVLDEELQAMWRKGRALAAVGG